MKKYLCLALFALLCACAKSVPDTATFTPGPDCEKLYALLPENYIIELESGAEVFLNPALHEFMVFCTAEDAARVREKAYEKKLFAVNSQWRIYILEGYPGQLARYCANGQLCLKQPAKVIEWFNEEEAAFRDIFQAGFSIRSAAISGA